ncbi:MAG: thioredoxin family protein [Bacteroidales bacterium]|nr:thioredoxin family protein [Bacteroidales bacterium]
MLYTNLKHIETAADFQQTIAESGQVVIVCGRMGEFSIPVYRILEELQTEYTPVKFFDMEYDNPESSIVCELFADESEAKVPFLLFYENGELIYRTWGTKTREDLVAILREIIRNMK